MGYLLSSYSFVSNAYARTCFNLWMDRSYVLRRVDTLAIVDRSIQQQRITLDIDRCALEAAGGPPRQQVIQPTRSTLSQAQKNCRNPFIILCKLLSPESSSSTDVMPENHSPRCMTHLEMRLPIMMLRSLVDHVSSTQRAGITFVWQLKSEQLPLKKQRV